jgi:hypothetical protein
MLLTMPLFGNTSGGFDLFHIVRRHQDHKNVYLTLNSPAAHRAARLGFRAEIALSRLDKEQSYALGRISP